MYNYNKSNGGRQVALLTQQDQKKIDAVIEGIKLQTGLSYPQNSLLEFAMASGIQVFEVDLSSIGANASGVIEYDNDKAKTNPRIFINANVGDKRKVFTLAHELGHHFLHSGKRLRIDDLDYSQNAQETKDETEANYFAASL